MNTVIMFAAAMLAYMLLSHVVQLRRHREFAARRAVSANNFPLAVARSGHMQPELAKDYMEALITANNLLPSPKPLYTICNEEKNVAWCIYGPIGQRPIIGLNVSACHAYGIEPKYIGAIIAHEYGHYANRWHPFAFLRMFLQTNLILINVVLPSWLCVETRADAFAATFAGTQNMQMILERLHEAEIDSASPKSLAMLRSRIKILADRER